MSTTTSAAANSTISRAMTPASKAIQGALNEPWVELIERIEDKMGMSNVAAAQLVRDTVQFIIVCGTKRASDPLFSPTEKIDQCWHEMLLFSRQYLEFCVKHFGVVVHHLPFTRAQRASRQSAGDPHKPIRDARQRAIQLFGSLSENWYGEGGACSTSCADPCSGSTNCQAVTH